MSGTVRPALLPDCRDCCDEMFEKYGTNVVGEDSELLDEHFSRAFCHSGCIQSTVECSLEPSGLTGSCQVGIDFITQGFTVYTALKPDVDPQTQEEFCSEGLLSNSSFAPSLSPTVFPTTTPTASPVSISSSQGNGGIVIGLGATVFIVAAIAVAGFLRRRNEKPKLRSTISIGDPTNVITPKVTLPDVEIDTQTEISFAPPMLPELERRDTLQSINKGRLLGSLILPPQNYQSTETMPVLRIRSDFFASDGSFFPAGTSVFGREQNPDGSWEVEYQGKSATISENLLEYLT